MSPAVPRYTDAAALGRALQAVLARPALAHGRLGVVVRRLDDGTTLFARNARTQLVPASNVKLVTTAAALDSLTPDFRFQTELYGALQADGRVAGDLCITGYGDPDLIPERVAYLVGRLRLRGVRHIDGNLVVDDSFFDPGSAMALGWAEDRSSRAYMAPAGALSVGFNALMVNVLPNATPGGPAQVLLDPPQAYAEVTGGATTVATGRTTLAVDVAPRGRRSVVRVAGELRQDDGARSYWRRIDQPAYFAGEVLRTALAEAGIVLQGQVVRGQFASDAPLLLTFGSPRLAELLVPLNKYSNNFMAMQLALVLGAYHYGAPASWPKAKRALDDFLLRRVGVPHGYALNNASGLHGVNTLSAEQLVAVLAYAHARPAFRTEFVNSLATAAGSGTLQDRMLDGAAATRVRAKTGTLAQASALSGYVDSVGGTPLAFSLLLNGYRHIEDVWAAQDAFAEVLASAELAPAAPARAAGVASAVSAPEDGDATNARFASTPNAPTSAPTTNPTAQTPASAASPVPAPALAPAPAQRP